MQGTTVDDHIPPGGGGAWTKVYRPAGRRYGPANRRRVVPRDFGRISISGAYRFLLVGGSGFLGQQLAQRLIECGHDVTISTRSPLAQTSLPKGVKVIDQSDIEPDVEAADAVVVLSVINNDVIASPEEVQAVNVTLPVLLARQMARRGKGVFVAFGSTHAEDARRNDPYSTSKRLLKNELADIGGLPIRFLVLPPIHGRRFVRKLKQIDRLPLWLRTGAVTLIGALKPLVHVNVIADQLQQEVTTHRDVSWFAVRRLADDQSTNPVYRTAIRTMDLALATAVLIGFGWLMLILAVLIRFNSHGPALFRQQRIGRNGRQFICYKFRTMAVDTPQVATHEVSRAYTTSLGALLRKWKLDELPQIFNVLAGNMSWVGPRPCLPTQTALIEQRQAAGILKLKAGITGLAQLRGIDMSDPVRLVEAEQEAAASRSIPQYVLMVARTFLGKGSGDRIVQ